MKTFYEMMMLMEDDLGPEQQGPELGLGNEKGQASPGQEGDGQQDAPKEAPEAPEQGASADKPKHYMFFSNLKAIKGMVEEMLAMDASQVDQMLDDGHDWASDHVSTSRDDVEEVYNWLAGEIGEGQAPEASEDPNASNQA